MASVEPSNGSIERQPRVLESREDAVLHTDGSRKSRDMEGCSDLNQWIVSALEQVHCQRPIIVKEEIMKDVLGHMCSICRIHLTWPSGLPGLPSTVVAKIPNTTSLLENFRENGDDQASFAGDNNDFFLRMVHETETDVYTMFSKEHCEGLAMPLFYGALPFTSQWPCILIEDIHSSKTVDVVEGFNDDELYQIVDQLVALHVYSYTHDEWKAISEKSIRCGLEESESCQQFLKMIVSMIEHLRSTYPQLSESLLLLHENFTKNMSWFAERLRHYRDKEVLRTFVHGDLWAANILWRNNKLAAIVDWALCHPGSLTEDLQRVLVTSCSVDRRLRMTPTLLLYYFKQMQIKMSEKNIEVPFTFEDLEDDYYRTLPYTCGQTVFAIGFWLRTNVIRKRKSDDETRVLEMVARLRSVVEETIAAHNWHHTNNI
ncbi:hypothetical protein V3C99_014969 [Haemonchus contortus]